MRNIQFQYIFKFSSIQKKGLFHPKNYSCFSTSQSNVDNWEKELSQISDYKEAISFSQNNQHVQANERFQRVIDILESSNQTSNPIYSHLLFKASSNILKTQDQQQISNLMKKGFENEKNKNQEIAKKYSINFILSTVHFDLKKAESHLENIKNTPEYPFFSGSLQILQGKSKDSIDNLKSYIETSEKSSNENSLLWRAYNNLGVAKWQNEYPRFNHFNVTNDVIKQEEPNIETAKLFKKALLLNNKQMKGNKVYDQFEQTPDIIPKEQIPRIDFYFDQSGSDVPLRCISDYLLDGHHSKRLEHTLWTKFYLKHFENNKREHLYRPLVSIAHHCQVSEMPLKSEGLFNTAITMLNDVIIYFQRNIKNSMIIKLNNIYKKNKTIEKALCEYYLAQMIGKIDKREEESEAKKLEAREQYKNFPQWHHWMLYVSLPNLSM